MEDEEEIWMSRMSELVDVSLLLPSQLEAETGHKPLRELLGCLLEGALHDLRLPPSRTRDYAIHWIEYGTRGDFTFNDVCAYLGLDADLVRHRALAGLVAETKGKIG